MLQVLESRTRETAIKESNKCMFHMRHAASAECYGKGTDDKPSPILRHSHFMKSRHCQKKLKKIQEIVKKVYYEKALNDANISEYQKVKERNWGRWNRGILMQRLPSLILPPKWRMTSGQVPGNSLRPMGFN
jgi:hypothetical protein